MNVLHVISHAGYGGAAKQLGLLSASAPRDGTTHSVCVLGRDGPMSDVFRSGNHNVHVQNWTRTLDLPALLRLREIVRDARPDVIHAWDFPSLRIAVLIRGNTRLAFTAPSFPYAPRQHHSRLDQWLLTRPDEIITSDLYSARRYAQEGRSPHRVRYVAPFVQLSHSDDKRKALRLADLPPAARRIVCVGPMTRGKGFRDALWALDILKCVYDDLSLILVGDGPEMNRLREFAHSIRVIDRVRFVGAQPDVTPWLSAAELVWIPSETSGGANVALEAMAAGKPVVASRVPCLMDIVSDGVTGLFFAPGDKVSLARQTHVLLQDSRRQSLLGDAGRRRVGECFSLRAALDSHMSLYQRLAA
jgi:glycosyltransferase involved in cell wall biosynthesis